MATAILRKITEKNDYEDLDDSETKKSSELKYKY